MIIPANSKIDYIKVSKSNNTVAGENNCYLGLINIATDTIEKKFQITNFSVQESDGSYKQIPPDDFYSSNNCYLASLVYSTSKYVVASSWYIEVKNASYCWNLTDSDILSDKHTMDYGMDIEAHIGSQIVSLKTCVEELMGQSTESDNIQDLLNHSDKVVLAPKDYYISSPITLTSGKSLYGSFGKTRLILTNGCTTAINITNAEKVIIDGITIVGTLPDYKYQMNGIVPNDGVYYTITSPDEIYCTYPGSSKGGSIHSEQHITGIGNEIGIYAYHSEYVILQNIAFNNIDGSALKMNYVGKDYIKCANINNLFISNCFNGIWCECEHEFSMYNNVKISLCQVGLLIASGNLIFNNFAVTRCRIGVALSDGYNHGHGILNNFEIKHCQVYGLCIQDVNYGETIGELFMQYANIYIKDSIGICINKLTHTNCTVTCVNNVGYTKNNSILTVCGTSFTPGGNLVVK